MIAMLAGLPGKMKTLLDRVTSTRAANLDNLNATISSRAAASTALTNAVWTDARAGKLDLVSTPVMDKAPIAGGVVAVTSYSEVGTDYPGGLVNFSGSTTCGTSGVYADVVNISGSGVLTGLMHIITTVAGAPTISLQLVIDGVTISTTSAVANSGGGNLKFRPIVGSYDVGFRRDGFGLVFKTSLQIRAMSSSAGTASTTYYSYIRTS